MDALGATKLPFGHEFTAAISGSYEFGIALNHCRALGCTELARPEVAGGQKAGERIAEVDRFVQFP